MIINKKEQLINDRYLIIKGCIRCYYDIDGEEITTAFYTESETFSPICGIPNKSSMFYISCVEESIILVLHPALKETIVKKIPGFEKQSRIFTEGFNSKYQLSCDEYKIYTPQQRYLKIFKSRPDLFQRVPQYQIASYLGITPQSLSRIRNRISKKEYEYIR